MWILNCNLFDSKPVLLITLPHDAITEDKNDIGSKRFFRDKTYHNINIYFMYPLGLNL